MRGSPRRCRRGLGDDTNWLQKGVINVRSRAEQSFALLAAFSFILSCTLLAHSSHPADRVETSAKEYWNQINAKEGWKMGHNGGETISWISAAHEPNVFPTSLRLRIRLLLNLNCHIPRFPRLYVSRALNMLRKCSSFRPGFSLYWEHSRSRQGNKV